MYHQAVYPQAQLHPWGVQTRPRVQTGALGDYFRGFAIIIWLFLLTVSFWWIATWKDTFAVRESGFDKNLQYIGGAILVFAHLTLGMTVLVNHFTQFFATTKGRLLGGFCLIALALSPLSLAPVRTALYSLSTLAVFLVCSVAWTVDYERFRRIMFIAGVVLLGFLMLLVVHHGMGKTSVGGIQRNRYSQTAFAGMICVFLSRARSRYIWFAIAVGLSLLVNSRGTLLVLGVFSVVYLTLKYGMGRGILVTLMLAVGGVMLLAIPKIGRQASEAVVQKVARVNEAGRGLGSGFSGRVDTWQEGLRVFARSPAIGHGFRTRVGGLSGDEYMAHSGYINMLADVGLLGSALIVGALAFDFLKRFSVIQKIKRQFGAAPPPIFTDTLELNLTVCAFFAAESILWLFEPLYFNLGATLSVLFIFMVMAPYVVGREISATPQLAEALTR